MELALVRHELSAGWSQELPAIDSASTLVIVFGAPEYRDDTRALADLRRAYPQATIIGCSTSGEIFETKIYDEICSGLAIMLVDDTCPELAIDLKNYDEFEDIPTGIARLANGDVDTSGFSIEPGGDREKEQIRVFYRWPVFTDLMKSRIANVNRGTSDGKILLFATMTWQNEPF